MLPLGITVAALGIVAMVIAIVLNNVLWFRFTSVYNRRVGHPMPGLLLDFRGRWSQALKTQSADPDVERVRRQLRWSQVSLVATYAVVMLGVLLMAWR